jgi:hypothetical protein
VTRVSSPDEPTPPDAVGLGKQHSAQIIPFPMRPSTPVTGPLAIEASDPQRLTRALGSLQAALAAQRTALATWRARLQELEVTTRGLDDNMRRYQSHMRSLGVRVTDLHQRTRALEASVQRGSFDKN